MIHFIRTQVLALVPLAGLIAFTVLPASAAPGDLRWSFTADSAIRSSPAFGANGWLLFASLAGTIYSIDPANGSLHWKTNTGGAIYSSPTVATDASVFIGVSNGLLALDGFTGAKRWLYPTATNLPQAVYATPTLSPDGSLFSLSIAGIEFALDAISGKPRWTGSHVNFFASDSFPNFSSPTLDKRGQLFFGLGGRQYNGPSPRPILALSSISGSLVWSNATLNLVQSSPAIGEDGTVFIGAFDKFVYALDPQTGAQKWAHLTGDSISSSPALGPDGTLYVGANDGILYALDSQTGAEKWRFLTFDTIHSSPAVAADGTVYIGSQDQKVYAIDGATGVEKWSFATGGLVLSSPLIGPDGTVYIGSYDGRLYAFEGSAPLAQSAWPMFKGNPRHTGAAADSQPLHLLRPQISAAGFSVNLAAEPGRKYHLEYKDDLNAAAWTALPSQTATNVLQPLQDPGTNSASRFFRARSD